MKKSKLLIPLAAAGAAYALGAQALFSSSSKRDSAYLPLFLKPDGQYAQLVEDFQARMRTRTLTDLTIYSRDGLKLTAHWWPAENARRTILLAHGWHGGWNRDFAGIAEDLHDGGANLLFIEQRAQGASEGKYLTFGLMERYDIADWACRLAEFSGTALPIYLFGISMGAASVLMASALPLPDCVAGICADCGYTSPGEIIRSTAKAKTRLPMLEYGANLLLRLRTGLDYDSVSTLDALRQNRRPVLIVHGDADGLVPVSMAYENYEACAGPKSLLIVHGAKHGVSYLIDKQAYREKLARLFAFCEGEAEELE